MYYTGLDFMARASFSTESRPLLLARTGTATPLLKRIYIFIYFIANSSGLVKIYNQYGKGRIETANEARRGSKVTLHTF